MPTRRRSSAVKTSTTVAKSPTKSTTTPRKRVNKVTRTKKVAVTEVKQVPQIDTPKKIEVKVEAPSVKKPSLVRPVKTNLTREDYISDFKVRWEIHQFETQELGKDLAKLYQAVMKITLNSVNYVKESYNSAFN